MKNTLISLLLILVTALSVSCRKDECSTMTIDTVSCRKDECSTMTIDRTVLVYMATNNNLSVYSAEDVEELKSGYVPEWFDGGSGDVLLVYRHPEGKNPHLIRMYENGGVVVLDTLIHYPSQNSCVDTTFRKVMKDAFGLFPSNERGLIVSSHGTGWLPPGYYDHPVEYSSVSAPGAPAGGVENGARPTVDLPVTEDPYAWMVKSIGHESDDTEMDIDVFKNSLIYPVDWLILDCCLMGGVEVVYQLKDRCDYVAFSLTEILVNGFPYDGIMKIAFRKGSDVASRMTDMAELYYQSYDSQTTEYMRSATISVVRTSELPALASVVKSILDYGGRVNTDTLSFTSSGDLCFVQGYFRVHKHWFYDLDDYILQVCPDDNLYSTFSSAMERAVIYKAATPSFLKGLNGFDINHFSGLSTYVPRPENTYLNTYYSGLDWGAAIK